MDADAARDAARRILAEQAAGLAWRPLHDLVPAGDLDAAYAVQAALHAAMSEAGEGAVVDWKIALTSKAMQEMVGVDRPLAGAVLGARVHASPARVPASRFRHVGVECEVAVRLGADLPVAGAPWDRARVAEAVAACMPAFELVEDRDADYARLDAASLVAENCWNGGNVLGAPVERSPGEWLAPEFGAAATRLTVDGEPAGEGRVGDAMGHPFEAVAWIADWLAARGVALRRGMVIMTGSSVRTVFPQANRTCRLEIDGLGAVVVQLVA